MKESVILQSPILIVGYLAALGLCLFSAAKKTGFAVTAASVIVFAATSAYALLSGVDLYEAGAVCVLFFILNLWLLARGKGK